MTASLTDLLGAAVSAGPDRPAIHYFDGTISYGQLQRESDALAAALQQAGVARGDRLMLCLQNVPGFVIGFLAAARIGAVTVPVNPMYRQRELTDLIADCRPAAIIAHGDLLADVIDEVPGAPALRYLVNATDRQGENPDSLPPARNAPNALLLDEVIEAHLGQAPASPPAAADPLLIVYTSGTTGKPKGAMISHANLCAGALYYRDAAELAAGGGVLGAAPLFHVTGLSGHIGAAIASARPLVLCHRFAPETIFAATERWKPSFIVASITAFAALIDSPAFAPEKLASLQMAFSGGAPIPPALHGRIREATGLYLRNVYGLTETSAPVLAAPAGVETPVDPASGALSVGRPVPGTSVWIMAETGEPAAPGDVGEIVVSGPSVVEGYWQKPEATAEAMQPDGFRTGDVGLQDTDGWFYLVDRKKDMIIASGFKVWPREVEDVLYTHPAVREAAVVGVPDSYRGETVKAVVSLRPDATASPIELSTWCRERMAAYKYPRIVEIVDELPKNAAGKILRRLLV